MRSNCVDFIWEDIPHFLNKKQFAQKSLRKTGGGEIERIEQKNKTTNSVCSVYISTVKIQNEIFHNQIRVYVREIHDALATRITRNLIRVSIEYRALCLIDFQNIETYNRIIIGVTA